MAYTKVYADWLDYPSVTTPVDQAALEQIETGIFNAAADADTAEAAAIAAQATADAAIAKSLSDAKGDLVVASAADVFARLAVGTSGQVLTAGAASAISWATPSVAALTAALPVSPVNGDEIILVDSVSAPTYAWHLRYISAKTSNKWQFVGGSPMYSEVATSETTASATYAALTTPGPSVTLPVAGDYMVEIGCNPTHSTVNTVARMSYDIGATGAVDADAVLFTMPGTAFTGNLARARAKAALTAVALTAMYKTAAATATFQQRWMRVTPVAIGG